MVSFWHRPRRRSPRARAARPPSRALADARAPGTRCPRALRRRRPRLHERRDRQRAHPRDDRAWSKEIGNLEIALAARDAPSLESRSEPQRIERALGSPVCKQEAGQRLERVGAFGLDARDPPVKLGRGLGMARNGLLCLRPRQRARYALRFGGVVGLAREEKPAVVLALPAANFRRMPRRRRPEPEPIARRRAGRRSRNCGGGFVATGRVGAEHARPRKTRARGA